MEKTPQASCLALLPIAVFLGLFLGGGLWCSLQGMDDAFYQVSATVAILPAIILAILLGRIGTVQNKLQTFIQGMSDTNVLTMCLIYLLAGAYGSVAQSIGGVEATVNLAISIIPEFMLLPGIFLVSAFIATAMGTSMGTIAAVTPIAVGFATSSGLNLPICVGAVISGAMFGDNLSMISDTTIAAVRTQGCELRDKFKLNFWIAIPAMLATVTLLSGSFDTALPLEVKEYELFKVTPYILVLGLALLGVNVLIALTIGLLYTGILGLLFVPEYSLLVWAQKIYSGFTSMQEIMVLSLFVGGLGRLTKEQGGLQWLVQSIKRLTQKAFSKAHETRVGELSISLLVSLSDVCTANNTVAILLSGDAAREISQQNGVSAKRSASLLDIFSCVFQGILPYSAQVLLAGSLSGVSPFTIVSHIHYCYFLGAMGILSILLQFPRGKMLPAKQPIPAEVQTVSRKSE